MRIDERLVAFFHRPLMSIIAATDACGKPAAGRGIGFHLMEDREGMDVIFSGWQWPGLVAAIAERGKLAVTFVSPADYVSFQIKGSASLRPTEARDVAEADRFITAAMTELEGLGVPRGVIMPWLCPQEPRVARLRISEIYVQTPGPLAGMLAGAAAG